MHGHFSNGGGALAFRLVVFIVFSTLTTQTFGLAVVRTSSPSLTATVADAKEDMLEDYPTHGGVDLGNGWDLVNNVKTQNNCVNFVEKTLSPQNDDATISLVSGKSSLMNELQVSAEARVDAMFGHLRTSVKYANSLNVNENYLNFLVRERVEGPRHYAAPEQSGGITLKDGLSDLALNDPIEFKRRCGNGYVSAISTGGELDVVLTIKNRSEAVRNDFTAVLDAGYGGVSIKGNVHSALNKYEARNELSLNAKVSGAIGFPIPKTVDEIYASVGQFPAAKPEQPDQVSITPYENLSNWPQPANLGRSAGYSRYLPIVAQFEKFATLRDHVYAILESVRTHRTAYKMNLGEYILNSGVDETSLNKLLITLSGHAESLKRKATECRDSKWTNCTIDPKDSVNDYDYRILMPAAKESFPTDFQRTRAIKAVNEANDALNDADNDLRRHGDSGAGRQRVRNAELALRQARELLENILKSKNWSDELRQAVYDQWVGQQWLLRCRQGDENPCITGDELNNLKDRIPFVPPAAPN